MKLNLLTDCDKTTGLRVLYSFPSRIGTPGIGMTAWHQVSGLVNLGVEVDLYCGSCELPIPKLSGLRETLKYRGVKLPIRILRARAFDLHDRIVVNTLLNVKHQISVVHCWPSGALRTLSAAKKLGIKTVLERPSAHTRFVYEVSTREYKNLGIKPKKDHYATYEKQTLIREEKEFGLADKLLCPSEFVAKTFLEKGFYKEQLARHRYGYDPTVFSPPNWESIKKDRSPFTVIYVGECNPLKGLHFALKAWLRSAASNKGKFYICGRFIPNYKRLLKEFLLHPSVDYLGFLPDVSRIMRSSDALIQPSLAEGSALVTYEAKACGCVLLVSEASGAYCTHMHDGLVHRVGDVNALRKHIDLVASDRGFYEHLRKNSLRGLDELTWESAARLLVNIYKDTQQ